VERRPVTSPDKGGSPIGLIKKGIKMGLPKRDKGRNTSREQKKELITCEKNENYWRAQGMTYKIN